MPDNQEKLTAIILAAGKGTRMKSSLHKVLHPVAGRAMLGHLLDMLDGLDQSSPLSLDRVVVTGAQADQVEKAFPAETFVTQAEQNGTGHAVLVTEDAVNRSSDVLVLFGDSPLISADTVSKMITAKKDGGPNTGVVVLGFHADDPTGYGRIIREETAGDLARIVEQKDATAEEAATTLCNSGVMLIDGKKAFNWLKKLTPNNAAGELYLTDIVAIAKQDGHRALVVEGSPDEVMGVNSRADLAVVEALFQHRKRLEMMACGVTLAAPETVFFSFDTKIGADTIVEPNVVFGPGVKIAGGVSIKAFSHLEGANVGEGASVGPYARVRPGSDIGPDARVGNFVETKNAKIEHGAKISHLTYIGDARVGPEANIGAGTITCNYDGFNKSHTDIGAGAFIGSNSALVAPVTVGDGAIVGAGSVISKDVAADSIAITRSPQQEKTGAAKRLKDRQRAKKEKSR